MFAAQIPKSYRFTFHPIYCQEKELAQDAYIQRVIGDPAPRQLGQVGCTITLR